ncbi:hypothetical protein VB636_00185, partial [Paracoccus sp. APAP_BH8]
MLKLTPILLALQSQQLSDLTALLAATGRAEALVDSMIGSRAVLFQPSCPFDLAPRATRVRSQIDFRPAGQGRQVAAPLHPDQRHGHDDRQEQDGNEPGHRLASHGPPDHRPGTWRHGGKAS